jgi:hypothetical protein
VEDRAYTYNLAAVAATRSRTSEAQLAAHPVRTVEEQQRTAEDKALRQEEGSHIVVDRQLEFAGEETKMGAAAR